MKIAESTHFKSYNSGEMIFRDGDPGDCAYLIESGEVAVQKMIQGEEVTMATFGQGEIFGEMAILDGMARSASARALSQTKLVTIYRNQLFDQLQKTNPITHLLIKILLRRIRNTTDQLAGIKSIGSPPIEIPDLIGSIRETSEIAAIDKIRLGSELQSALNHNEFRLFYQPIVSTQTQAVLGFEALIRWQSPIRGLVPPNDFIDLLEESSLIHPVGEWIQRRAFADLNELSTRYPNLPFMSLNVSVRQLENSLFPSTLQKNMSDFNIDPKRVKLEVTERLLLDGQSGLELLKDAKELGCMVSIDDFGTGYSNFQSLTQFGFDSLKLDRGLLRGAMQNKKMNAVIRGIVAIANGLDLDLIAEGIEDADELKLVKDLGVTMAQGYYFSRPLPLEKLGT